MGNKYGILTRLLLLAGLILSIFLGLYTYKEVKRGREIEREIEMQRQEAERIKNNNQILREKISYFETPEYKERIAKDKFNFKKEDEEVVIIKPSPYVESQKEEEEVKPEIIINGNEKSNLIKWWDYFFKY